METMKKKGMEVLFCYEPYDELVLMNLGQFEKKAFKSIENEIIDLDDSATAKDATEQGLNYCAHSTGQPS